MSATESGFEVGLVVIGDEILSGRRRDRHLEAVITRLAARGLALTWAHYAGDDRRRLAGLLSQTMVGPALVFCCGGIGATPDDVTRFAAADAAGVGLQRHPEGVALLEQRFGAEIAETRLRMVDFPEGAALIPNPVNGVPGFQLDRHCFVPGFPDMAWPMIEWTLDHRFADWTGETMVSERIRVRARESDLVALLERLGAQYPEIRFSSLPEMHADGGFVVELGVRGHADQVEPARLALEAELTRAHIPRATS
jgi:molybdopterin-biosynthesis enzyme MoeA-like protein